jgi:siroheme decarboxylase
MDAIDHKLIVEVEKGLPLTVEPFSRIAEKIGVSPQEVIVRLQKLQENGVIRRFGVSVKPNGVGYSANALVAWKVPQSRVSEISKYFSGLEAVSHCYERESGTLQWGYNLYIVMHAHERRTIEESVKKLAEATNLNEYIVLYSKRNLKLKETKKC